MIYHKLNKIFDKLHIKELNLKNFIYYYENENLNRDPIFFVIYFRINYIF